MAISLYLFDYQHTFSNSNSLKWQALITAIFILQLVAPKTLILYVWENQLSSLALPIS